MGQQGASLRASVQFFGRGKRPGRSSVVSVTAGASSTFAPVFVWDRLFGRKFLVDTGASISLLPATRTDWHSGTSGPRLAAANDSVIRTFGKRTVPLLIGSHRYEWSFTIADVSQPILGADFLCANSLLVDVQGQRLIEATTFSSVKTIPATASASFALPRLAAVALGANEFGRLLGKYPELTTPTFSHKIVKHGVQHHITTQGPPVHAHARRKYSTFDRELLAIYLAVRHFRFYLQGRVFSIFTDHHKPLTLAMSKLSEPWSDRQHRHLSYISEFSTNIQHVAGLSNPVADALSRVCFPGVDYSAMAACQQVECDFDSYRTAVTGLRLRNVSFGDDGLTLTCDISTGSPRPVVPESWCRRVFDTVHGLSHPGVRATRKMVAAKFVWHGMNRQINTWAAACVPCQWKRFRAMFVLLCSVSRCRIVVLHTSILISWGLCRHHGVVFIC